MSPVLCHQIRAQEGLLPDLIKVRSSFWVYLQKFSDQTSELFREQGVFRQRIGFNLSELDVLEQCLVVAIVLGVVNE